MNLKFEEEPTYAAYIKLFEPLLGAAGPSRPLQARAAHGRRGACRAPPLSLLMSRLPPQTNCNIPFSNRQTMQVEAAVRVGQKRGREQLDELTAELQDGGRRKKVRAPSLFPFAFWEWVPHWQGRRGAAEPPARLQRRLRSGRAPRPRPPTPARRRRLPNLWPPTCFPPCVSPPLLHRFG